MAAHGPATKRTDGVRRRQLRRSGVAAVADTQPDLRLAPTPVTRGTNQADHAAEHRVRVVAPAGAGHGRAHGVRRLPHDATDAARDPKAGRDPAPPPSN